MNSMMSVVTLRAFFSPSALNEYLDCRLKFYYHRVAGLKTPDEVSAEIDSALFGTIFHRSSELVYNDLITNGKEIRKEDLEQLLRNDVKLQSYVDCAFKEKFFHVSEEEQPEYNGTQLFTPKSSLPTYDNFYVTICNMPHSVWKVWSKKSGKLWKLIPL